MRSDTPVPGTTALEREDMRRDRFCSRTATSLRQSAGGFRMASLVRYAAAGSLTAIAASVSPQTAHAQEYPWCLSREGYLYCFYKTQEQCQWTASGIGGCALNPRLLFPIKPRDS
jgi:hypothetical protein